MKFQKNTTKKMNNFEEFFRNIESFLQQNQSYIFKQALINKDFITLNRMLSLENFDVNKDFDDDLPNSLLCLEYEDNKEAIKFLIEKGYDMDKRSSHNWNVFLYACVNERIESVKLMLEHQIPLPVHNVNRKFNFSHKVLRLLENQKNYCKFKEVYM